LFPTRAVAFVTILRENRANPLLKKLDLLGLTRISTCQACEKR